MSRGPGLLRCWTEQYGSASVVYARGEVDLSSAPVLRRCLERASATGRSIIVDLRGVTYLDGTGFRILEEAHTHAREQRMLFWIIPCRHVERLVALLHLDDAIPLKGSVDDALEDPPQSANPRAPLAPDGGASVPRKTAVASRSCPASRFTCARRSVSERRLARERMSLFMALTG